MEQERDHFSVSPQVFYIPDLRGIFRVPQICQTLSPLSEMFPLWHVVSFSIILTFPLNLSSNITFLREAFPRPLRLGWACLFPWHILLLYNSFSVCNYLCKVSFTGYTEVLKRDGLCVFYSTRHHPSTIPWVNAQ